MSEGKGFGGGFGGFPGFPKGKKKRKRVLFGSEDPTEEEVTRWIDPAIHQHPSVDTFSDQYYNAMMADVDAYRANEMQLADGSRDSVQLHNIQQSKMNDLVRQTQLRDYDVNDHWTRHIKRQIDPKERARIEMLDQDQENPLPEWRLHELYPQLCIPPVQSWDIPAYRQDDHLMDPLDEAISRMHTDLDLIQIHADEDQYQRDLKARAEAKEAAVVAALCKKSKAAVKRLRRL